MHSKFSIIRQPHYSPTKFIKQVQRNFVPPPERHQFVPFAQERDGLGKLIKNQKEEPLTSVNSLALSQNKSQSALKHSITPETCITLTQKADLVDQFLNRSFQFHDPKILQISQSNRIPIHKLILPKTRKYSDQDMKPSKFPNQLEGIRRARFLSSDLTQQKPIDNELIHRSQSLPRLKTDNKINLTKKTIQDKMQLFESLKSYKGKQEEISKNTHHGSKQKIVLPICKNIFNQKLQSLQSYRRWPKLNENIEKANEIFLTKMREGKKLAYKLKISLQSQQWFQQ